MVPERPRPNLYRFNRIDRIQTEMISMRYEPPEGSFPKWTLQDTCVCLTLLAIFLASRFLWIATSPESSSYWEEAYRWAAVEQLGTAGANVPLSEYQADQYQGGSLVVIVLAAALGAIGIHPFVALKLVALGFSGSTLVALYFLGHLFFGRLVALLSGMIFVVGPPLVAFWGVVAMGFHSESALLSLCVLGIFLALMEGLWTGPRAWLGFGVASGLAIWFAPTAGIYVVACVVAWPFLANLPRVSCLLIAALGFLLGMAPWLAYNFANDFAGLDRIFEVFGARPSADFWRSQSLGTRAVDLLLNTPTQGLLDPGGDLSRPWPAFAIFGGVWGPTTIALTAAMVRALRIVRTRRAPADIGARREFVFLVCAIIFSAALMLSRFNFESDPSPIVYRLIAPLAVFLILPIAASAARGLDSGGLIARWTAVGFATALTSLAVATLSFAIVHVEAGTPLTLRGGYVVWGRLLYNKYSRDIGDAIDVANHVATDPERGDILRGIGWGMRHVHEHEETSDLSHAVQAISAEDRKIVLAGLGWALERRRVDVATELEQRDDPQMRHLLQNIEKLTEWIDSQEFGNPAPNTARQE